MMLVLDWRSLQLVAAPLVSRVGQCCSTAGEEERVQTLAASVSFGLIYLDTMAVSALETGFFTCKGFVLPVHLLLLCHHAKLLNPVPLRPAPDCC
jgi:hypothetical protein